MSRRTFLKTGAAATGASAGMTPPGAESVIGGLGALANTAATAATGGTAMVGAALFPKHVGNLLNKSVNVFRDKKVQNEVSIPALLGGMAGAAKAFPQSKEALERVKMSRRKFVIGAGTAAASIAAPLLTKAIGSTAGYMAQNGVVPPTNDPIYNPVKKSVKQNIARSTISNFAGRLFGGHLYNRLTTPNKPQKIEEGQIFNKIKEAGQKTGNIVGPILKHTGTGLKYIGKTGEVGSRLINKSGIAINKFGDYITSEK